MLKHGSRGDDVRAFQQRLALAGFAVDADGIFGPKTLEAIKTLQGKSGLEADGIVGPKTIAALDKMIATAQAKQAAAQPQKAPGKQLE
ncbi:MAG: peptidoglycan-binding protein [Deltaproteobacteria bacterium]|nr:peptidoglycan-binding protein [Deltaproteobacteria bacterium]